MVLNQKAYELRSKLFNLINEYKALQLRAHVDSPVKNMDAVGQIDSAACRLAEVYESLGELFIDVAYQEDMQSFAVEIGEAS